MKAEVSSVVSRTPEEAFDFLVHLENEAAWNPWAKKAVRVTDGEVREGTVYRATYKRFGELEVSITGYDRPRRFVISTETKQMSGRHELLFERTAGGTKITQRGDMQPRGIMKLMSLLMGPMVRGHFRDIGKGVQAALRPK